MAFILWGGCSLQQLPQSRFIGDVGHFEYRAPDNEGVIVAVPRGTAEAGAIEYAQAIRDELGAGLVVAYNFAAARIPVDQPPTQTSLTSWSSGEPSHPGSVYSDFQALLQSQAGGSLKFYVGVGMADESRATPRIEVASAGLTFEQQEAIERAYAKTRDRLLANGDLSTIEIAINPRRDISWDPLTVKNHGVLLHAERGLILRLPTVLATSRYRSVYRDILANWGREASHIAGKASAQLPSMHVQPMRFGRIDTIPARNDRRGVVIAAPHGGFDWYTGELVQELSYRTALPAVVARGFTPIECDGWRINVNRPTELRYPTGTIQRSSDRAKEVYDQFTRSIFAAARGPLNLYIGMHQNTDQEAIEVATLGVTVQEATAIKSRFVKIRDRLLRDVPDVAPVNLIIEPIDSITIGAWAAKEHGVLRLAKRSLHFELPAQPILVRHANRRVYAMILAELFGQITEAPEGVVEAKAILPISPR